MKVPDSSCFSSFGVARLSHSSCNGFFLRLLQPAGPCCPLLRSLPPMHNAGVVLGQLCLLSVPAGM